MNVTLGAGFTSRLVREVRAERGLSYGVGSNFDTLRAGGLFFPSLPVGDDRPAASR